MQTLARLAKRIPLVQAPQLLTIAVCAAFISGTFLRFVVGRDLPLWIDEAWTGAIAGQATLEATMRQSLSDANAPLYFVMMHFWTKLFGLSDAALRFPSFVFGAMTPLVVLIPTKGLERNVRLLWCGLAALWIPGIWYSQEARCYSLALFLAMACTLAYVRLLAQPCMRAAMVWALLGSLAIVTHYHSLLLVGCQGIGYLAVYRARSLRMWPAMLFFLPAFAWLAVHLPRVLQYADQKVAFQPLLKLGNFPEIIAFVVGDFWLAVELLIVAIVLAFLAWRCNPTPVSASAPNGQSSAWIAVGASVAGAIITIFIGVLRPSFTLRYLMVFIPGILLGFALVGAHFGQRWKTARIGIVVLWGIFACNWSVNVSQSDGKSFWNFEQASLELERVGIDQLVFLFDNPLNEIFKPHQLEALGGFFLNRDGLAIPVVPIFLKPGDDPNLRLLADATSLRSAILWLYDLSIRETAALSHPARIEHIDRNWVCRNYGKDSLGVVACHRN